MSANLPLKDLIGLVLGTIMIGTSVYGLLVKTTDGGATVGWLGSICTGVVGLYFFGRSFRNLFLDRS